MRTICFRPGDAPFHGFTTFGGILKLKDGHQRIVGFISDGVVSLEHAGREDGAPVEGEMKGTWYVRPTSSKLGLQSSDDAKTIPWITTRSREPGRASGGASSAGRFLERFYELFMASSPKVAELFQRTDLERQKQMLRDSLYVMLVAAGTTKGPAHDEVERLAKRHRDVGVTDDMFALWLDALIAAAREHDTHFSDDLERDWRSTMSVPIALMKAGG